MDRKKSSATVGLRSEAWTRSLISSKRTVVLVLILAGIMWTVFYATHSREISGSDDREYVSIARNIVNGKGIVRNAMYPIDINFFSKVPVPEFVHPPGYPLIIAGFFKLFGISDGVGLLPSYLSFFALVLLMLLVAQRTTDTKTAVLATVILIFNKEILEMSLVALSEEVYTLIFSLFLAVLIRAKSGRGIFAAGLLMGVSHLVRENMYAFLLPTLVYLSFPPQLPRSKKVFFFILGCLIPLIPNMIRTFSETGSLFAPYGKFGLMAFTDRYPWLNIYRNIDNLSLFEFLMDHPGQLIWKYAINVVSSLEQLMTMSSPYVLAFFCVEMFYWKDVHPEWARGKRLLLSLLVFYILFVSLFTLTDRFFYPFLPFIVLFASRGFLRMTEEMLSGVSLQWKKAAYALSILLFLLFFTIRTIFAISVPGHYSPVLNSKIPQYGALVSEKDAGKITRFVSNELKENQVVWTDVPEIFEWKDDRPCGWLPTRIDHIYEIRKKVPVDAILLTNVRTPNRMEEQWRYLLFSEHSLPGYRTVKVHHEGRIFAKLLIRDDKE